jgi:hypothetical protein
MVTKRYRNLRETTGYERPDTSGARGLELYLRWNRHASAERPSLNLADADAGQPHRLCTESNFVGMSRLFAASSFAIAVFAVDSVGALVVAGRLLATCEGAGK